MSAIDGFSHRRGQRHMDVLFEPQIDSEHDGVSVHRQKLIECAVGGLGAFFRLYWEDKLRKLEGTVARHDMLATTMRALVLYRGNVTAVEAAGLVGCSVSRFRHQFTRVAGMSFRSARVRVKLEYGLLLLRTTTLSIPDISAVLGYSDRTKFEKSMKRLYGVTPTQYRRGRYAGPASLD